MGDASPQEDVFSCSGAAAGACVVFVSRTKSQRSVPSGAMPPTTHSGRARGNVRRHLARPDLCPRADRASLSLGGRSGNPAEFSRRPQCRCGHPWLSDAGGPGPIRSSGKTTATCGITVECGPGTPRSLSGHGLHAAKGSQASPAKEKQRVLSYGRGRVKGVSRHGDREDPPAVGSGSSGGARRPGPRSAEGAEAVRRGLRPP